MVQDFQLDNESKAELLKLIDAEVWRVASTQGLEVAGAILNDRVEPGVDHFTGKLYWDYLKREFFELMCESGTKYAKERAQLASFKKYGEKAAIAISAAIAGKMLNGVDQTLLIPFISMILLGLAKLGLNAWCSYQRDQIRLEKEGKPVILDDDKTS